MLTHRYKLKQVLKIGNGKDHSILQDGKYPVYGSGGLMRYVDSYLYEGESILLPRKGTLSNIQYVDGKFWTVDTCYYSVIDKNIAYPYYLYRLLKSCDLSGLDSGASIPSMTSKTYYGIKVELPDVQTQQKIASILTVYDNLIENNNKRIKILEQMAENLYKEWFVRFRFPCRSKIILQKQSPNGWVISSKATDMVCPGNWEYGSFSRLGKFVRGKNITADKMIEGNIPVVSAGLEPSGYHNVHNVTGKSLTISASGANAGYLKYHLSDIWAADCSYFQDDSKLWFVYNALKFLQPVISNLQIGAAQPHVYPKNINKLCTVIPDDDTMHMYCEKVEPIYEQIQRLKEENQNLIKQRDMLLPRLMSGKLEV